jgi:hypothetical protein
VRVLFFVPRLALLELVLLDMFTALPEAYPLNYEEHDDNVTAEEEGLLIARLHLACSLVRDIYHFKLLPHLDDHKLKWRPNEMSTESHLLRGSNWSLPIPMHVIERMVRIMLPLFIAHEEICTDCMYRCPCWNDLLPSTGFAKVIYTYLFEIVWFTSMAQCLYFEDFCFFLSHHIPSTQTY